MLSSPISLNVVGSITTRRYTRFFRIALNIDKRVSFIVHVQTPGKFYLPSLLVFPPPNNHHYIIYSHPALISVLHLLVNPNHCISLISPGSAFQRRSMGHASLNTRHTYHHINCIVHVEYNAMFIYNGYSTNVQFRKRLDDINNRCVHRSCGH